MINFSPSYKSVSPIGCYVYLHRRATDGSVFYVGKGTKNRGWQAGISNSRNPHWQNVAAKNNVFVEICQDGMTQDDANLLEMWLISKFRNEGLDITNKTEGGEGFIGLRNNNRIPVTCSNGMEFSCAHDAAIWLKENGATKASSQSIWNCCIGRGSYAYGFQWWYSSESGPRKSLDENGRKTATARKVFCCNGLSFKSCVEAYKWCIDNGITKTSHINIAACARGKQKTSGGLEWSYEDKF